MGAWTASSPVVPERVNAPIAQGVSMVRSNRIKVA